MTPPLTRAEVINALKMLVAIAPSRCPVPDGLIVLGFEQAILNYRAMTYEDVIAGIYDFCGLKYCTVPFSPVVIAELARNHTRARLAARSDDDWDDYYRLCESKGVPDEIDQAGDADPTDMAAARRLIDKLLKRGERAGLSTAVSDTTTNTVK